MTGYIFLCFYCFCELPATLGREGGNAFLFQDVDKTVKKMTATGSSKFPLLWCTYKQCFNCSVLTILSFFIITLGYPWEETFTNGFGWFWSDSVFVCMAKQDFPFQLSKYLSLAIFFSLLFFFCTSKKKFQELPTSISLYIHLHSRQALLF